jgi:hypothetical protein
MALNLKCGNLLFGVHKINIFSDLGKYPGVQEGYGTTVFLSNLCAEVTSPLSNQTKQLCESK